MKIVGGNMTLCAIFIGIVQLSSSSKEKTLMAIRIAETTWNGTLQKGNGNMKVGSGAFEVPFSFGTRFGDTPGTNPEELIGDLKIILLWMPQRG